MKYVCTVCGYVYEGENPPAECPVCHAKADKFVSCLNRTAVQAPRPQHSFLPHLFSCERKDGAVGDISPLRSCDSPRRLR